MTQQTLATALDLAQARADAGGEPERLAFFRLLAQTPLFVLLEREVQGEILEPRIFDLDEGPLVLAFDREERLAAMGTGPQSYVELPGRVLARLLAEQGLGLGLNLASGGTSEQLLPPPAMAWLGAMLDASIETRLAPLGAVEPPEPALEACLRAILADAPPAWAGTARALWVCACEGRALLLVEGAAAQDEPALARALAEALAFAGRTSGGAVEITFAAPDGLAGIAARIDWPSRAPAPATVEAAPRSTAPGMDMGRPPILR